MSPDTVLIDHLVIATPQVSEGDWASFYTRAIRTLQPGVTEIIIHLGFDDPELQSVAADHPDYGAAWRQRDLDFFTSEECAKLLADHGIRLVTWREIGRLLKSKE